MAIFYYIFAFAIGLGIAVQAAINSRLAAGLGAQPLAAAFFSFAIGTLVLGVAVLWQSDLSAISQNIGSQAWWRWLGGAIGAVFVFATAFLAPKIGLVNMAFLIIVGQLIAGMVIDGFGLIQMPVRTLSWQKYAGLLVMLAGLVLFMFGDRLLRR
ncbi:hypothetical protein B0181_04155 [Moraxella caviae]|uniref:Uncharacterized protein conserved in bacteria n=1 Tax=Moraxella caviae TaxID=34060 RepID=A0A1T0A5B2_9GAMM|nr:DMT family transporter [Moraxella caviae]OOR90926.1 hypothetical protein B0181_04155 [Moraxella caviae]STZ10185.1 Uncharacterized protein conserved in bacteria [Moraxella caviae]